jgi:PqqD family protein of HPr-rel-A system
VSAPAPWRVISPETIALREWDDELVVYNDGNGDTHHLAPLAGKVLLALMRKPAGLDAPELINSVGAMTGIDEASVLAPVVEEALDELARLGLVASVPD